MAAPGYNYQGGQPPMQGGYPPQMPPGNQQGPPMGKQFEASQPPFEGGAEPSAPTFGQLSGYENAAGFDYVPAGPPPPYQPPPEAERPAEQFDKAASITDNQATDALQNFVGEHCCYGKSPAKDLLIKEMQASSAYHYKLESFAEARNFNWQQVPYTGQPIDGPENGPAPPAWSIPVQQPPPFQPTEVHVEIPHTANVKTCHMCRGKGHIKCTHCHGHGEVSCNSCGGNGHQGHGDEREDCPFCHDGERSCSHCNGRGDITCHVCKGNRKIMNFLRLTVKWVIHVGEHVVEKTDLPDELIKQVSGMQIFGQEFPRVFPLTSFFDQEINGQSERICNLHNELSKTDIIHRQRHNLRAVPVNEVQGIWKDVPYRFWVYGAEHKVYCPDYPQKCCCGCTIL